MRWAILARATLSFKAESQASNSSERRKVFMPLSVSEWILRPQPEQKVYRTLVLKSLRHHLPRLLLALDVAAVLERLVERLRSPSAVERTRPNRSAPRRKGVRIADFHPTYKAA